jgi:ubiquinone/menaquinone biosynthesis C-methylase UbiE
MRPDIDSINLRTMRLPQVVAHYARSDKLLPHERAALNAVADEVRGGAILDIGVGGGRTVEFLLDISTNYLGIDYCADMVAASQMRYPKVRFEHADARELSGINEASIDLAVFSCNGISMVGHDDRLRIMKEVHRVLKPGGVFLFTTYNRSSPEASAGFAFPDFEFSPHPGRLMVRAWRHVQSSIWSVTQRLRFIGHEVHADDGAQRQVSSLRRDAVLHHLGKATQPAAGRGL